MLVHYFRTSTHRKLCVAFLRKTVARSIEKKVTQFTPHFYPYPTNVAHSTHHHSQQNAQYINYNAVWLRAQAIGVVRLMNN
jgi:hypothetical protein